MVKLVDNLIARAELGDSRAKIFIEKMGSFEEDINQVVIFTFLRELSKTAALRLNYDKNPFLPFEVL